MPKKNVVPNKPVRMKLSKKELKNLLKENFEYYGGTIKNSEQFTRMVIQYMGLPYLSNIDSVILSGIPLHSLGVSGKFGDRIFFNPKKRKGYIQKHRANRSDKSPLVKANQNQFKKIKNKYRLLSPSEKADFLKYAQKTAPHLPPFALWIKEHIHDED